jgi:hypothetical protein
VPARSGLLLVATLTISTGCSKPLAPAPAPATSSSATVTVPASPGEPWARKPPAAWPQLALTNEAEFEGHSGLSGASSFLVTTGRGRILAATARHLIGKNGGVDPEVQGSELDRALRGWRMFPRTSPNEFVEVGGVGATGLDGPRAEWPPRDWLLLSIKPSAAKLPAVPLRLREAPVQVGEAVFLVGCPYVETGCRQNVYAGTVKERRHGDRFRYDLIPPVDIRGFSGAPILDESGLVVGVMTVWFDAKKVAGKYLEAGGEDAAAVLGFVEEGG